MVWPIIYLSYRYYIAYMLLYSEYRNLSWRISQTEQANVFEKAELDLSCL